MQVQRIQNNCNSNQSFKSVYVNKSALKVIKNMTEAEHKEFDNIIQRLSDTKFWDMQLSKVVRDADEFWCTFVNKKNPKKIFELGINPIAADGSKVEIYPIYSSGNGNNSEIIKFSSPQRAKAMMDMRKIHAQEMLQRNYKSTNLQRLTRWTDQLEFLDEAYRYMKSGEIFPFDGSQTTIVKKQTILDKILKIFGYKK